MRNHLINVRLDDAHLRKVHALRDHGVVISDLVREAIDTRFDALGAVATPPDVKHLVGALFTEHPDDASHRPRPYDVHDRKAARAAVRKAMGRKRP